MAAREQVLALHPGFSTLEAISVALIHDNATPDGTIVKHRHIEGVIGFRKGRSGRFSVHIT